MRHWLTCTISNCLQSAIWPQSVKVILHFIWTEGQQERRVSIIWHISTIPGHQLLSKPRDTLTQPQSCLSLEECTLSSHTSLLLA